MKSRIGILIPTRNRPNEIQLLLESLLGQQIDQVIVAGSGSDLSRILEKFKHLIAIEYVKSNPGQIVQKMTGIKSLRTDLDWVIFSDDDVVYPKNFIEKFRETINMENSDKLSGIGFQITNGNYISFGKIRKIFNNIFCLQNGAPGVVNSSGDCIPYSNCKVPTFTMWLNGASAWRYKHVLNYGSPVPETKYAAYEDAIFSFGNFAPGTLRFFPHLQLSYQVPANQTQLDSAVYESYLLWKMYFVVKFNLSMRKYILSSFGLSLIFLFNKSSQDNILTKFVKISQVQNYLRRIYFSDDREKETIKVIKTCVPTA